MANSFRVLDKMFESDPTGQYAVAFMSPDNFIEAKSGKNGWGWIKMAVNNDTINKMFLGGKIGLVLFAFDVDKYREISKVIEATPQDVHSMGEGKFITTGQARAEGYREGYLKALDDVAKSIVTQIDVKSETSLLDVLTLVEKLKQSYEKEQK